MVWLLSSMWESRPPLKVKVFSWQLFQNRISTRQNLFSRSIILDLVSIFCVFCNEPVEPACHIFVRCPCLDHVWYHVLMWLGWVGSLFYFQILRVFLVFCQIYMMEKRKCQVSYQSDKMLCGLCEERVMLTYFWGRSYLS